MGRIVRPGIHLQDVLHPAHEGGVLLGRDTPHLVSPRLDLVFFSTLRTVSWEIERTIRRRFNSSHSICSVHRARPAGGSLQAMAINCASPSPSSTAVRSRLRLRRPKAASSPSQHTALTNPLDVLRGDPYLTRYLAITAGRPIFSLVSQQEDLGMPAAVGSHRSFLHQRGQFLTFRRAQIDDVQLLHYHPSQCDCGLRYTSEPNPFVLNHH